PSCVLSYLLRLRPLPALHSFPTRRSSDLRLGRRVRPPRGSQPAVPVRTRRRHGTRRRRGPARRRQRGRLLLRSARRRRGGAAGEDRKSTRLNSSHVSISYAVFCLKKKKTN